MLAILAVALAPPASAQAPDPGSRMSLTPRLGAGWSLGAHLLEGGGTLTYELPGGLAARADVAAQFLVAGCSGWCDLSPWMLTAGAGYHWNGWGRRLSLGA